MEEEHNGTEQSTVGTMSVLIIGPPTLLHIYNGREFCNKVIALFQLKHGIKMVIGKPRHSQSQGSVKRGNRDINDLIRAWQAEKNSSH